MVTSPASGISRSIRSPSQSGAASSFLPQISSVSGLHSGSSERFNRGYDEKGQALYSYRLVFDFKTDAGILSYLNGKSFQVQSVDFAEKYFPGYTIPGNEKSITHD